MLNVIIAIVGNTYSTYESSIVDYDLEEKLDYINDFDKLMYMLMKLMKKIKSFDLKYY